MLTDKLWITEKKEYTLKKGDKIIVRLARNGGFASVIE